MNLTLMKASTCLIMRETAICFKFVLTDKRTG